MTDFSVFSRVSRAALCILIGLCLGAGFLPSAGASSLSSFTVTRTADDNDPGSLRSAIASAATSGGTVTFSIPTTDPGYNSTANTDTITLALGPLIVPGSLSISGPAAPSTTVVVSGGTGANASRVFSVIGGTVTFDSLTITGGNASQSSEPEGGGGVLNTATLTLTNCLVTGNTSNSGDGMGVNNRGSGANLTMTDCTVSQNRGTFGNGAGIANSGTLTATRCLVSRNMTSNSTASGGGLSNSGTATLNTSTFSDNVASPRNLAYGRGGAGAYNTGSLTLNNCLVSGNSTLLSGGGINNSGGTLTLSACTISSNYSGRPFNNTGIGGGIYNVATAQITNCLVVNNVGYSVGGMYNDGPLTLTNSTFTGNLLTFAATSGIGGVIGGGLVSGPATLVNDIFAFDMSDVSGTAVSSEIIASDTVGPTVTYSDVQGGYPGTGNINADPQFVQNPNIHIASGNGDEHLKITSPAVYAGTNSPMVPLTDIEGTPHPAPPATPSMGAYEVPGTNGFSAQGGFSVTGTHNQDTGAQVVAKFLPGPTAPASFTATVDFGDGTGPTTGMIAPDPVAVGVLDVKGSHTYSSSGTFTVTVVVSGPGGTPTATVISMATIQPFLSSLAFPSPVPGGTVLTATVALSGPALSDTVVGLSSSDSAVVRLHRSVIVPMGSSNATFQVNTFRSHVTKTVTITATLDQASLTQSLTITGR